MQNNYSQDLPNDNSWEIHSIVFYDIPEIMHIANECDLSYWSRESYKNEIKNELNTNLKLTSKSKIVGFIISRLIMLEPYDNNFENSKNSNFSGASPMEYETEILNFAVASGFQRRGCGQRLYDGFQLKLKRSNVKTVWLEVRKSNNKAINFYKKQNFQIKYERKNFYASPVENALVMQKFID